MFKSKEYKFIIFDIITPLTISNFFILKLDTHNCYLLVQKKLTTLKTYVKKRSLEELYQDKDRLEFASEVNLSLPKTKVMPHVLTSILAILTVISISANRPLTDPQHKVLAFFMIVILITSLFNIAYTLRPIISSINNFMYTESFKIINKEIDKKLFFDKKND